MYHTQGKAAKRLIESIPTKRPDAWLGTATYFWYYYDDAIWWGVTAKKKWVHYEIYKAEINCENVLDTVFNEKHYTFWIKQIEAGIKFLLKGDKKKVSLKYLNDFFNEKGTYEDVEGVMFQDISDNPEVWTIPEFQYKKRIQLAVYNDLIISNFVFDYEGKCAKL